MLISTDELIEENFCYAIFLGSSLNASPASANVSSIEDLGILTGARDDGGKAPNGPDGRSGGPNRSILKLYRRSIVGPRVKPVHRRIDRSN